MTEILSGFCAGIAQVAVGHPFDTIKVLMQNNKPWLGLPITSYYQGWKFPLISATIFNCTVFPVYEYTIKKTENNFISGGLSGLAVTPLVYLFDIGKIKRQVNEKIKLEDFYKTKGLTTTTIRETLAMITYFGSYNYFKEMELHPLISGGLAGLTNWTATYPIDVMRSRQIAQNITIKEAFSQGYLWRGFNVCALRAILVNGAIFFVYEKSNEFSRNRLK